METLDVLLLILFYCLYSDVVDDTEKHGNSSLELFATFPINLLSERVGVAKPSVNCH